MLVRLVSVICILYVAAWLLMPECAQLQIDAALASMSPSGGPHMAAAASYAAAIS
jgi:hypothetical protein